MKQPTTLYLLLFIICINLTVSVDMFSAVDATPIESLPFKQSLDVPIDTSNPAAKFQPIDLRIKFTNPCWAYNESVNSIRVAYDDGSGITELESQIYDLEYTDDTHVEACSLVFIIPQEARGRESYYVLYDDAETEPAAYIDHLTFEDTHYYYEPISGQKIDFDYYKILEDGYVVYGIAQKGDLLGNGVSHMVAKLSLNTSEFETINTEQLAWFSMSYSIDDPQEDTGSAWATEVKKTVMVDGNLMIRIRIESLSPEGTVKTDNIYTYYYCPGSTKRLAINVNHEVLQTTQIEGNLQRDGTYALLSTIKARSASIDNMNFGAILPSLHLFGEEGIIKEYAIPPDPNTEKEEWLLSTIDDIDVGERAWVCNGDPATGKTHGLIFESNAGFLSDEQDGIQIKAATQEVVKLPGLEADAGIIVATRNAYDKPGQPDTTLNEGLNVSFDMEFITFENEGHLAVDTEFDIFQALVTERPIFRGNVTDVDQPDRYTLTAYVHFSPSFPLGSILSAVSGKNISYLSAELYRNTTFSSSGSIGRLSLSEGLDLNFDNTTLVEKIQVVLGLFDWGNATIIKTIKFPDLDKGEYLIKIYRENPFIGAERQYIGFQIVNIQDNTSIHITTKSEGEKSLIITDQYGDSVENTLGRLLYADTVIAEALSDANGSILLKAPRLTSRPYILQVLYNGFLLHETQLRLKTLGSTVRRGNEVNISLHQFSLNVKDLWDFPPAVEVNPILTSDEMLEPTALFATKTSAGRYTFHDVYPSKYTLNMGYKSFTFEETIDIRESIEETYVFPAEFEITVNTLNSYGTKLDGGSLSINREGKTQIADIEGDGMATFSVPPGMYQLTVASGDETVSSQLADIKGPKTIEIVTNEPSLLHTAMTIGGLVLLGFSIVYVVLKKNWKLGVNFAAISLLIISVVSSWWTLKGSDAGISTYTKTYLIPSKMVAFTESYTVFGGNIDSIPDELILILTLLAGIMALTIVFVITKIVLRYLGKFPRLSRLSAVLSVVFILLSLVLFAYAMSQLTEVGVGSFIGSGELEITLPGDRTTAAQIDCSWGPGQGFYLALSAMLLLLLGYFVRNRKSLLNLPKTSHVRIRAIYGSLSGKIRRRDADTHE